MAKMTWKPAPPEAAAAFAAATEGVDGLERRKMFGYSAVFANNRMVAGLHEVGMVLRLSDADRERLVAEQGAKPFVVMGRVMREYVVVPASLLVDMPALQRWVGRGLTHASSMPPKSKSRSTGKKKAAEAKKIATPPKPKRPAPAPSKAERSNTTKAGKATTAGNASPRRLPSKSSPGRRTR